MDDAWPSISGLRNANWTGLSIVALPLWICCAQSSHEEAELHVLRTSRENQCLAWRDGDACVKRAGEGVMDDDHPVMSAKNERPNAKFTFIEFGSLRHCKYVLTFMLITLAAPPSLHRQSATNLPTSLRSPADPKPSSSSMRGCISLLLLFLTITLTIGEVVPLPHPPEPEGESAPVDQSSSSSSPLPTPPESLKTLPGPHPADPATHPGLSALEQARSEANTTADHRPGPGPVAKDNNTREYDNGGEDQERAPQGEADTVTSGSLEARNGTDGAVPPANVRCADGPCVELGAALLAAVEGEQCRSLFINGKCPAACGQGIASVTGNESWSACATACGNDVVTGAAERWSEICEARQETLIDQGKEVVKGLVGEGLSSRLHWRAVVQFFLAVLILVVGVGYGYRRGAISTHYAYRLQKRRLIGRKNSDNNLPI